MRNLKGNKHQLGYHQGCNKGCNQKQPLHQFELIGSDVTENKLRVKSL